MLLKPSTRNINKAVAEDDKAMLSKMQRALLPIHHDNKVKKSKNELFNLFKTSPAKLFNTDKL
jgi:hypothetical protein